MFLSQVVDFSMLDGCTCRPILPTVWIINATHFIFLGNPQKMANYYDDSVWVLTLKANQSSHNLSLVLSGDPFNWMITWVRVNSIWSLKLKTHPLLIGETKDILTCISQEHEFFMQTSFYSTCLETFRSQGKVNVLWMMLKCNAHKY